MTKKEELIQRKLRRVFLKLTKNAHKKFMSIVILFFFIFNTILSPVAYAEPRVIDMSLNQPTPTVSATDTPNEVINESPPEETDMTNTSNFLMDEHPLSPATLEIQLIQVCDDGGMNCANPGRNYFEEETRKVWEQAGVDINYLEWVTINDSTYQDLSVDEADDNYYGNLLKDTKTNVKALKVFFVNSLTSGARGMTFGVGTELGIAISNKVFDQNTVLTLAHEIGNALGLTDNDIAGNLMNSPTPQNVSVESIGEEVGKLTEEQIDASRNYLTSMNEDIQETRDFYDFDVEPRSIRAETGNQVDVQWAIDLAQDGDTVIVPEGEWTWTQGIVVTKGITLQGEGIGKTIIYENTGGTLFRLETVQGKSYRISGFEFRNGSARTQDSTEAIINAIGNSNSIRLDHNKWDRLQARHVRIGGYARGVSDHNIHLTNGEQVYHMWHEKWAGGGFGDSSWSEEIDWGGSEAWYIESNYIEGVDGVLAGCTDTYGGARFVFRYNELVNAALATHGTGDGAGRNRGLRQFEVYSNTITYIPPSSKNSMHVRGGTGIYFDNLHTGVMKTLTLHYYRSALQDKGMYGNANGLNPFDINDPAGAYVSGLAGAGSTSLTLEVPGANWEPNQWVGYTVNVPVSSTHPEGTMYSVIVKNDGDTIWVDAGSHHEEKRFVEGEYFEIRRVLLGLDQPGAGTTDLLTDKNTIPTPVNLHQKFDPIYDWGNTVVPISNTAKSIKQAKDAEKIPTAEALLLKIFII